MDIKVIHKTAPLERLRAVADYLKGVQALHKYKSGEKYWVIPLEALGDETASKIMSDYLKGLR